MTLLDEIGRNVGNPLDSSTSRSNPPAAMSPSTYLHGATPGPDRTSALYGSALWGIWHLPVAFTRSGS
jgi:hypothetical protein